MSKQEACAARWFRAALQINPFGYKGKVSPSIAYETEAEYNTALLDTCDELGIEVIAVTDHWRVRSAEGLLRAAQEREICALPGFEANSSEGVHLLVIFDEGTALPEIDAAIGMCGVTPGCSNGELGRPFEEILSKMTARGAMVIPAHANVASGGMLTSRSGKPLEAMVNNEELHAIAITPDQPDGRDQELIFKGTTPYQRSHPLARIHSDDVSLPEHLKKPGASTWFKSSTRTLQGLKLAVRTPETRVSLNEPQHNSQSRIDSIRWTGGYLDGVEIPICDDLTALIGGRGAGKSTVIESIRYAVGAEFLGERTANDGRSIISNVLQSGTVVELGIKTAGQANGLYRISRTVPENPVVIDPQGQATELKPSDVLGDVEIYGQHELAELAGSPSDIAQMVKRFSGQNSEDELLEIRRQIACNRQELQTNEAALADLQELLSDIPRLEAQVHQYSQNKVADRLADKRRIDAERLVFQTAATRLTQTLESSALIALEGEISTLKSEIPVMDNSPNEALQNEAKEIITAAAAKITELKGQIESTIRDSQDKLNGISTRWSKAVAPEVSQHAEVLRTLNQEGLEPDKYIETSQNLQALKAREPQRVQLESKIKALEKTRRELLDLLASGCEREREALVSAIKHANSSTNSVVIVKPVPDDDRALFHDIVSRHVEGRRDKIAPVIDDPDFDPKKFSVAICGGSTSLKELGITPAQASSLVNAGVELVRDLEETHVKTVAHVSLKVPSRNGKATLKPIESLSKGQRATALLLLLLGASDSPLIIDQPEDDLDNRFVFDGVVSKLRAIKGKRQILVSTHNANVPVLGDAEQIVVLEGDGQRGRIANEGLGSLDNQHIRSFAEDILEGGSTAFRARHHLYGF